MEITLGTDGGGEDCVPGRNRRECGRSCALAHRTVPRPGKPLGEQFPVSKDKENPNMKNLSHLAMLLAAAPLALGSFALAQQKTQPQGQGDQDKLVEIVRSATAQYVDDVKAATRAGYGAALGCVSGSDHGAMGIHYVNGSLLNGPIAPTQPQALIYEPQSNGELKLVGVEFIILASALPPNAAPQVEGHLMLYVDGPNRYGLPPFYELHVWAWRDNPQGPFVDWNDHVTCANQ
jgi:hypothetical protein